MISTYKKCWDYLKESKNHFALIFLILLLFSSIGFFFPYFFVDFIEKFIKSLLEKTTNMNFYQLFLFIFQNNITTSLIGMISGIVLGIFPLFLVIFNGYVLGFIARRAVTKEGFLVLTRLLPHGIFELPALIISLGLGLKMASFIFAKTGERKKQFYYDLENSLRIFLFIVLPLLLIAALIEAFFISWLG